MENEKIKTSRASQARSKVESEKVWSPPNSLDAPPAPTGFRHQWIRSEILGASDAKNVASSLREGWELVRADQYPDTCLLYTSPSPRDGLLSRMPSSA